MKKLSQAVQKGLNKVVIQRVKKARNLATVKLSANCEISSLLLKDTSIWLLIVKNEEGCVI